MLVTIGIIALLIGILVPAIVAGRRAGEVAATKHFMMNIGVGLTTYRNESALGNTYPPSDAAKITGTGKTFGMSSASFSGWNGGEIIVQALMGYQSNDGKSGLGYTRSGAANGSDYGPYVTPESFEVGNGPNAKVFQDQWEGEISYFRARPQPFGSSTYSVWGSSGSDRFDSTDNSGINGSSAALDEQESVDNESLMAAPFVLYSMGNDGKNSSAEAREDDIVILAP